MANKRIKDFNSFVNESYYNEIDEGVFSTVKKYGKMIIDWSYQLLKNIIDGLVAPIPYGPKKGLPTIMLFIPGPGESVYQQMAKYERGIDQSPGVLSNLSSQRQRVIESEIPLEYTQEESDSEDAKDGIIQEYSKKSNGINSKSIFIKSDEKSGSKIRSVGQAGDELTLPVLSMELKYIKPDDLFKNAEMNIKNILPPDNGRDKRGGIIFLDDIDQADKLIIDYFNELSKSGEVDGYRLPNRWIIVASGKNPDIIGDLSGFKIKK